MAEKTTSIRAASRKNRVYVFRDFLLQKYDLHEGDVVLDVAGGKGDLSWLLRNVDGIDSVVVDPRIVKNYHIVKSIRYLREHPEAVQERSVPNRPTYQPLAALLPKLDGTHVDAFDSPRHLRMLVNEDLVTAIRCYLKNQQKDPNNFTKNRSAWETYWETAIEKAKEAQPLGYREEVPEGESSPTTASGAASAALHTILSTKLVVGFHPDQATDACMELARALGVPYCIVPCCVFPKEFPNRRLADGTTRIRSYSQLIAYLQLCGENDKDHRYSFVQRIERLPFHFTETAKNLALYTTTTAMPSSSSSSSSSGTTNSHRHIPTIIPTAGQKRSREGGDDEPDDS
jgi:hypothetical protein